MNLLEEFNKEFIKRHDFYSEDLDVLFSKWQNKTTFTNIPEAWILPIDTMLLELNEKNLFPKRIEQKFGQLFVMFSKDVLNNFTELQQIEHDKIVNRTIEKIKLIDEDLYLYFDIEAETIYFQYLKENTASLPTYH